MWWSKHLIEGVRISESSPLSAKWIKLARSCLLDTSRKAAKFNQSWIYIYIWIYTHSSANIRNTKYGDVTLLEIPMNEYAHGDTSPFSWSGPPYPFRWSATRELLHRNQCNRPMGACTTPSYKHIIYNVIHIDDAHSSIINCCYCHYCSDMVRLLQYNALNTYYIYTLLNTYINLFFAKKMNTCNAPKNCKFHVYMYVYTYIGCLREPSGNRRGRSTNLPAMTQCRLGSINGFEWNFVIWVPQMTIVNSSTWSDPNGNARAAVMHSAPRSK